MSQLSWNAIKFIQRPSSHLLNGIVGLAACSFFLVLAVGTFIPVNQTVTTTGVVVSELGEVEVNSLLPGIFYRTVEENSMVQEGQIIGSIQPRAFSKAQLEYMVTLLTFKNGKNFEDKLINLEKLFHEYSLEKIKMADLEISLALLRVYSGFSGYQQVLTKNNEAITSETKSLKILSQELQRKINSLKKEKSQKEFSFFIESLDSEKRKSEQQVSQIENTYQAKTLASRQTVEDEARRAAIEISSYILYREIKSPVNGRLLKWLKENKTNVLTGAVLAQIIPDNSKVIAKVDIVARDLSKIEKGQDVLFRFEAFPYEKHGTGSGEVIDIKNIKNARDSFEVKSSLRAPASIEKISVPIGSSFRADIIVKKTNLSLFILNKVFGDRF